MGVRERERGENIKIKGSEKDRVPLRSYTVSRFLPTFTRWNSDNILGWVEIGPSESVG